jgi:hypothetical protein
MKEHNAPAAWVVAHGAAVRIAPTIADAGVPLHVTVHDDPAWAYALLTRRYLGLAPLFAHDLGRTLRSASSVDVISSGMARRYRELYGVEAAVVHRAVLGPVQAAPPFDRSRGLSVAILGSTYGLREVQALAAALAVFTMSQNVPTTLIVIGGIDNRTLRRACPPEIAVQTPGHVAEKDAVDTLRRSFLLYASYPFARRGTVLRTTSFPTKLSTYALAARPLLLHAPQGSSLAEVATGTRYTTPWTSLDPHHGAGLLQACWHDRGCDQSFDFAAEQQRAGRFDFSNRWTLVRALNGLVSGPHHPRSSAVAGSTTTAPERKSA